jgi:DNA-binding SARP family transcriptional activator
MSRPRTLRLNALGEVAIHVGGNRLDPSAEILFASGLYLILEKAGATSRTELQEILWPHVSQTVRAHRLRQTLLKLKQTGFALKNVQKTKISLNGQEILLDYESLLANNDEAQISGIPSLRILPGYEPRFSDGYAEWLDSKRSAIERQISLMLLEFIAKYRDQASWKNVQRYSERLLELQPYSEEATLALAEALALAGNKRQALDCLDRYLKEEGLPSADLRAPAATMRRKIADRLRPREDSFPSEAPFVGRSGVMGKLIESLSDASNGHGRTCLVWGEAGVGKSRVLTELAALASLRGVAVQRHHCRPTDKQRPLSVFVDLVPRLRNLRGSIGCAPETVAYLDKLTVARSIIDRFEPDDETWEGTYARIHQALFDLLDAVSYESSILLVLEDAHWLDAASARLVGDIALWARDRGVMMALSSREPIPGFDDADFVRVIHLDPLTSESSNELVLGILRQRGREISHKYLEWCVTVTEGNPYFLQELAGQWIETETELVVPPSLAALISQRLSRLDPDSLHLLQTVAALDQNSTLARVESVLEYDTSRLLRSIGFLEDAGLLVKKRPNSGINQPDVIVPKHDLLAESALSKLSPAAKAYLHRRIGTVLERDVGETTSTTLLWDCVRHWQRAGDAPHAFRLAIACANHLMDVGLPYAASDAYEQALSFCTKDDERVKVLPGLAHAHYRSSAWQKVGEVVGELNRLRSRLGEHFSAHDEFELMNLRADWRNLRWDKTRDQALLCLQTSEAEPTHRVEAGVMALMLLDICCDHDAMDDVFSRITSIAAESDVKPSLLLQARMVYHTARGNLQDGMTAAANLLEEERRSGNVGDLIRALCNHGQVARVAGMFGVAKVSLMEALRIARQNGISPSIGRSVPILASMALELGWHEEAREWHELLRHEIAKLDDRYLALDVQGLGVRLALIDGDAKRAAKLLSRPLIDWKNDPVPFRRTYQAALEVATQLACSGRAEVTALEILREAHMLSRIGYHQAFAAYALSTGLKSVGRPEEGAKILREYLESYRPEPWPAPQHLLERLEATLRSS